MTSSRASVSYRFGIAAAAAALLLQGAHAAPIANSVLAEIPLQGLNPVKPNIVFTLDDSGSMAWDFLPDIVAYVARGVVHCRDGLGASPEFHCGGATAVPADKNYRFTLYGPPVRSSAYNNQYYDPTAVYVAGKSADGINLPYENANPGTWTSVYVDGFAGYPGANVGGTVNLTNGYPDTAWCNTHAVSPPSSADVATAFADGSRCRLNGRVYAQFTDPSNLWSTPSVDAGYNYPNVKDVATGTNTACSGVNVDCVFKTPVTVTTNPYYYTISRIQYCSNKDAAGFGTAPCQDRFEAATFRYVRYGDDPAKSFDPQAFTRVDIVPSLSTYPSGRSYADEMANFARWYTFYRTRVLALKTAAGTAFAALSDENARVGFHTLWENGSPTAGFLNVGPFDASHKASWFSRLYAVAPNGGTPLPDAVYRIGEYFSNSGSSGLPGAADPLDPTTGMCQPNYHLLSTDGYWNRVLVNSIGNKDHTVPGSLPGAIPGFTPGSTFPRPYYEGPTTTSNNLADLAMHY